MASYENLVTETDEVEQNFNQKYLDMINTDQPIEDKKFEISLEPRSAKSIKEDDGPKNAEK